MDRKVFCIGKIIFSLSLLIGNKSCGSLAENGELIHSHFSFSHLIFEKFEDKQKCNYHEQLAK